MISATIVNKQHLETGTMEAETLRGFTSAAELLGFSIGAPEAFLRDQQARVFAHFAGRDGAPTLPAKATPPQS